MKKFNLTIIVFFLFPLFLSAMDFGAKFEISGGPIFSGVIGIPLSEKLELDISAGGFPEMMFGR